jgi:hypothetical protein
MNRLILSYGSMITDSILYTEMVKKVQVMPSVVGCVNIDITRYQILSKEICSFSFYEI